LMGLTTYYQQRQLQGRQPQDPSAQQMQAFGKIMPIFLTVLAYSFPSGLVVYWLTTNLWTIGQQRFMFQTAGSGDATSQKASGPAVKKPAGKRPGTKEPGAGKPSKSAPSKGDGRGGPQKSASQEDSSKPNPNRKKKKR
ncbi:MAG: YidC/Oxa1 family membrane protein insertase, partial [Actinomycetota bacterium]|nr:YidC/Oxa1 family membrane protein insertase [Actinomycetota bacterium]